MLSILFLFSAFIIYKCIINAVWSHVQCLLCVEACLITGLLCSLLHLLQAHTVRELLESQNCQDACRYSRAEDLVKFVKLQLSIYELLRVKALCSICPLFF